MGTGHTLLQQGIKVTPYLRTEGLDIHIPPGIYDFKAHRRLPLTVNRTGFANPSSLLENLTVITDGVADWIRDWRERGIAPLDLPERCMTTENLLAALAVDPGDPFKTRNLFFRVLADFLPVLFPAATGFREGVLGELDGSENALVRIGCFADPDSSAQLLRDPDSFLVPQGTVVIPEWRGDLTAAAIQWLQDVVGGMRVSIGDGGRLEISFENGEASGIVQPHGRGMSDSRPGAEVFAPFSDDNSFALSRDHEPYELTVINTAHRWTQFMLGVGLLRKRKGGYSWGKASDAWDRRPNENLRSFFTEPKKRANRQGIYDWQQGLLKAAVEEGTLGPSTAKELEFGDEDLGWIV